MQIYLPIAELSVNILLVLGLGGAVGLSLRIGPTRAVRGDVAEFAVGYRFGKGFTGSRWGLAVRKGVRY